MWCIDFSLFKHIFKSNKQLYYSQNNNTFFIMQLTLYAFLLLAIFNDYSNNTVFHSTLAYNYNYENNMSSNILFVMHHK